MSSRKIWAIIWLIVWVTALAFLMLDVSTHLWNSDLFYFEAIYRDLFIDPHPFSRFHFSAASFLVPDLPLYLILRSFITGLNGLLLVYMMVQFGVLCLLFRAWFKDQAPIKTLIAVLLLFGIFDSQWWSLFYPVHHGGQFLAGMLLLFWMGPHLGTTRWWLAPVLGLIASSDLLFCFNVLGPYFLTLALRWPSTRRKALARDLGFGLLILVLLLIFYFAFQKLSGAYFGWNKPVFGDWARARDFAREFLSLTPRNLIHWMGLLFLALRSPKDDVARFLLVSVVVSAISIVVTGGWAGHEYLRYFFPFALSVIYGWVKGAPDRIGRIRSEVLIGLMILGFGISQTRDLFNRVVESPFRTPYPTAARCLDRFAEKHGVREGAGGYWAAKYLSFLSRQSVRVLQVRSNLEPYYWINNHAWYDGFKPRFLVVGFPGLGELRSSDLGRDFPDEKPSLKEACEGFEIWLYPEGVSHGRVTPHEDEVFSRAGFIWDHSFWSSSRSKRVS